MNPLVHFRWYRRWRGGVWGRHSALLHPWKTWSRFDYMPADFSARLSDGLGVGGDWNTGWRT